MRLGFLEIGRRGSHVKMEHPDGRRVAGSLVGAETLAVHKWRDLA